MYPGDWRICAGAGARPPGFHYWGVRSLERIVKSAGGRHRHCPQEPYRLGVGLWARGCRERDPDDNRDCSPGGIGLKTVHGSRDPRPSRSAVVHSHDVGRERDAVAPAARRCCHRGTIVESHSRRAKSQDRHMRVLARVESPLFAPGTRHQYRNGGYVLLAELLLIAREATSLERGSTENCFGPWCRPFAITSMWAEATGARATTPAVGLVAISISCVVPTVRCPDFEW